MILTAVYKVQWGWQARLRAERTGEEKQAWLARALQLVELPTPFKDRSLTERTTLKRLVNSPGYSGI